VATPDLSLIDQGTATAIIANYALLKAQVYERVEAAVKGHWFRAEHYDRDDIERIANEIIPLVQAGQKSISQLTALYLDTVLTAGTAVPLGAGSQTIGDSDLPTLRGVSPSEEFLRAGITIWTALKDGDAYEAAVKKGLDRLVSLVTTDVQLAQRWTENRVLNLSEAKFWRRVPRGVGSCALCVLASTQRYHVRDLKPIHPGCQCTVAPIILRNGRAAQFDPGRILNEPLLEQLHKDIGSFAGGYDRGGRAPSYKDILIREHGELGPVLTWRDQHFTGPDSLAA